MTFKNACCGATLAWFAVFHLVGCKPADPPATTYRQQILDGRTVTFDKPGFSLCGSGRSWTEMRLSDDSERARVVLQKQSSVLNPGHSACYRVGDVIDLGVNGRQLNQGGRIRIESLSLSLLDKLNSRSLKGLYFASSSNFESVKSAMKTRLRPTDEGIVTVVNLTYLSGSAVDEKSIRQRDEDLSMSDGFEQTLTDGDFLPGSSCKKTYTYVAVPQDLAAQFSNGSLQSWYTLTDASCLQQGAEVDLSPGKDLPVVARVRLLKLRRFRVHSFATYPLKAVAGFDYSLVNEHLTQDLAAKPSEWMVVADFELLSTSGGQK